MKFTLSVADCRQQPQNKIYPNVMTIEDGADLLAAAEHDHIAGTYTNNERSISNFLQADVLIMDCDNDHSEDPADWKEPADLQAVFRDARFCIVYSRNHMKEKHGKAARPRWHVYFPLRDPITDADTVRRRKKQLADLFPYFDQNALDAARFLYGVDGPQVEIYDDLFCIDETLPLPPKEEPKPAQQSNTFTAPAAGRKYERDFLMEALEAIPCVDLDRKEWALVGMALKAEGYGYEVFDAWSRTDPARYDDRENLKQWNSFKGSGTTAGTIYHIAERYGYHRPTVDELREEGKAKARAGYEAAYADYLDSLQYLEPDDGPPEAPEAVEPEAREQPGGGENIDPEAAEAAKKAEKLRQERDEYLKNSAGNHLQEFLDGVAESARTKPIPTHFEELDRYLDGGLYEGLYILGAISSLGKTALCMQICDQIAKGSPYDLGPDPEHGNDVLVFSLEMARTELMSRSISRETLELCSEYGYSSNNAKTARGITAGYRYAGYDPDEQRVIALAVKAYGEYAGRMYIHEGVGDIGVNQIRHTVYQHIQVTGNKPVVLIDYLQLLHPADLRATDKQNTDRAVLELKRISRDFKIPVIAISSFNRENYSTTASMKSFKESGAIEYSSDVLFGMQFEGAGMKDFDAEAAGRMDPRHVELKVLKNRNGPKDKTFSFFYYPRFNLFEERF